jgi:hypothetical protein
LTLNTVCCMFCLRILARMKSRLSLTTILFSLWIKYSDTCNTTLEFFPDKPGWTPTHWMTTWLPFGKWISTVEHAWAGWRNTVTDPEHMAAVELVREILSSENEDWKTWVLSFATTQGDKPYTVADLLGKVVNQDKLLNAGGTKKKATSLLAGHGISRPIFKPKYNQKGKQKKRCATKDCKNIVSVHFHKFCDDCYSSRKEKSSAENESSALDDVPATVREQHHNRNLTSLKKKMAQMSSVRNKQKRKALLQQANALLADMAE